MFQTIIRSIMCFVIAFTAMEATGEASESALRAGFAERVIAPQGKQLDPCKARAFVVDDGTLRVALVGFDDIYIPRYAVLEIRQKVQERCGIDAGSIMIGASHTHAGGRIELVRPQDFEGLDDLTRRLFDQGEERNRAKQQYVAFVIDQTVEAIVEADANRTAVRIGFGSGREDKVSFNRRHHMKNGRTFTHPRQNNSDMLGYAGPIDPEVGVIGVWDKDDTLLGCVVNFACHATTTRGRGHTSADYIRYIEQVVRGTFGEQAVLVFLNGASGDVTQVDNLMTEARPLSGKAVSQFVGGRVGAEAVKVLFSMWVRTTDVTLNVKSEVLSIARRAPAPERVAEARRFIESAKTDPSPAKSEQMTWMKNTVMLDALIRREPKAEVEVQAIQVGSAVFLGVPAEYFCQFGMDMKAASRFPWTFPVSLANGCVGYVPTEAAFSPAGGGYETRLTAYSNLVIDAGRLMADTAIHLANSMTPDEAPKLPPAPPFVPPLRIWGTAPPQLE